MKGNTLNEFINDLYTNGGPEKEFILGNKYYIIQADSKDGDDKTYLRLDEYLYENNDAGKLLNTIWIGGTTLTECVDAFEKAQIFDGKTIYEVEKDIEVLFG
ncbi:MAG: hypothetical protein J6Z34_07505 [Clostridia bacterium]|nr:hypothetical protein [Clostridia bacterium]